MNKLSVKERCKMIHNLVEGNSLRACSRLAKDLKKCSINTVTKLLEDFGRFCIHYHNENVVKINALRLQADEMHSFTYCRQKNIARAKVKNPNAGDTWTWTAIDPNTKLIISWHVGKRDAYHASLFMQDVAARLNKRIQLTTDGLAAYIDAVDDAFGGQIDYAQLVKRYEYPEKENGKKGRRKEYAGADKTVISGKPREKYITTAHVEVNNRTMRMSNRRLIRKTNGYTKKMENLNYSLAIYFVYYNFVRIHSSLRVTPAMEAGLKDRWVEMEDLVIMFDEFMQKEKEMNGLISTKPIKLFLSTQSVNNQ